MAAKKNGRSKGGSQLSWRDRVHFVSFSRRDEEDILSWRESMGFGWVEAFEELVDDGWGLKITPDAEGGDLWVSVTAKSVIGDLNGHTFTFRYPAIQGGVLLAYYISHVWTETRGLAAMKAEVGEDWLGA
jgi:hypothetical protein